MIAYKIYIMAARSSLPHEGVKDCRFLNKSFDDAIDFVKRHLSSESAASGEGLLSLQQEEEVEGTTYLAGISSASLPPLLLAPPLPPAVFSSISSAASPTNGQTPPSSSPIIIPSAAAFSPPPSATPPLSIPTSTPPPVKSRTFLGRRKAAFLHTHFYLNSYEQLEADLLDEMWTKPILHVGELVSGDEKVFHYTAKHMNTKAVKNKSEVWSL